MHPVHRAHALTGFVGATGNFLTGSPYPRLWRQATPYTAAEPGHAPVPERYAALFTAELHSRLEEVRALATQVVTERYCQLQTK